MDKREEMIERAKATYRHGCIGNDCDLCLGIETGVDVVIEQTALCDVLVMTEQKANYELQLTALRSEVETLRHAETVETLRDVQVDGWVCPACFSRLWCHCSNCFERNKDKAPYLWKPDGQWQYCSVCTFSWFADMSLDLEYCRLKFNMAQKGQDL